MAHLYLKSTVYNKSKNLDLYYTQYNTLHPVRKIYILINNNVKRST